MLDLLIGALALGFILAVVHGQLLVALTALLFLALIAWRRRLIR